MFGREFGSLKCFSVRLLSGSVSEWSECPLSWVNFLVQSAFGIYTANHERGFILLGWPVIRKYFPDSPIFHVLKGWNSVLIGAVDGWNHSSRGWFPFFTQLKFKWVTMTTRAKSDVIPWELLQFDESNRIQKDSNFLKISELNTFFSHFLLVFWWVLFPGINGGIKHFSGEIEQFPVESLWKHLKIWYNETNLSTECPTEFGVKLFSCT